jgi:hypothetical protein
VGCYAAAVAAALSTVEPGQALAVRGVAIREPAAAVLALLRAPWRGRLEITVRTPAGDVRHTAP